MIRHLLHMIWNQRKGNGWIAAEILFVFIALWYIIDTMMVVGRVFYAPMGWDIDHVYFVSLGVESVDGEEVDSTRYVPVGKSVLAAVDRIKTCPGVASVGVAYNSIPYGNVITSNVIVADTLNLPMRLNEVTPGFMEVFRFHPADGEKRGWEEMLSGNQVILSDYLYQRMKEKGADRGQDLVIQEERKSIGGIVAPFRSNRFNLQAGWVFESLSDETIAGVDDDYSLGIVIRVQPEADVDFPAFFAEKMGRQLSIDRLYLLDVIPYTDIRDSYELMIGTKGELQNQMAVMGFLLFNIFLGIIGTFWFRTERRRGEMGLRVAMGSTRLGLQGIMIGEGLLLLTLVAIPSALVCLNMQWFELTKAGYMEYTAGRFLAGFTFTYLLLAGMILLGIWYPARQTARLEPAEALRHE